MSCLRPGLSDTGKNKFRPVGRFAPTPSGPLHFGSLFTAVCSWLDIRSRGGLWYLRLDDHDKLRNRPGSAGYILRALESHGLFWDGAVAHSNLTESYHEAWQSLVRSGRSYACRCSRKNLVKGKPYPGTCAGLILCEGNLSWRLKIDPLAETVWTDRLQGECFVSLAKTTGDFIIKRRDGFFAYHLTTVIDDASLGVNSVMRGMDLLESTAEQIELRKALHIPIPEYAHLPVLVNSAGQKLSKQTFAAPLDVTRASENLAAVLRLLGLFAFLDRPEKMLEWAIAHWSPQIAVLRQKSISGFG